MIRLLIIYPIMMNQCRIMWIQKVMVHTILLQSISGMKHLDSFGARRDFPNPADEGIKVISTAEHNFGWAGYATKRDNDTENFAYRNGVTFKADIFNAFVAGRAIIHNEGTVDELAPHMATIRTVSSNFKAANVVHYVHSVLGAMDALTESSGPLSSESENYNKYWSEMRGFIISYSIELARYLVG